LGTVEERKQKHNKEIIEDAAKQKQLQEVEEEKEVGATAIAMSKNEPIRLITLV
jgi:hypothetical protein